MMSEVPPIGVVEHEATESVLPKELRDDENTIIVNTEYAEGLYRIKANDYLVVIFHLHLSDDYTLRDDRLYGSERGVFASRSPNRLGKVGDHRETTRT